MHYEPLLDEPLSEFKVEEREPNN